jgi:hypothetical protein
MYVKETLIGLYENFHLNWSRVRTDSHEMLHGTGLTVLLQLATEECLLNEPLGHGGSLSVKGYNALEFSYVCLHLKIFNRS